VAGLLTDLKVDQFDRVTKGQTLAKVSTMSPENMEAALAVISADLQVTRARMMQDQQRNDLNYQQTRMDLLGQRIELATAKIRLQQAESEFERVTILFKEKIAPAGVGSTRDSAIGSIVGYEVALRDRDALRIEVEQKTKLISDMEQTLQEFKPPTLSNQNPLLNDAINAAVSAQEEQLRRTEGGTALRAPMDGIVSVVNRRSGENIAAGEPILTISSERAERIIGFLRLPFSYEPKVGDTVEIRTRGSNAQKASATIQKVGSRMELFTQPLRVRGFAAAQERGLPILINLPESLKVYPGEIVDLFVKRTVE
jgi:multidrug resistance efflux pump